MVTTESSNRVFVVGQRILFDGQASANELPPRRQLVEEFNRLRPLHGCDGKTTMKSAFCEPCFALGEVESVPARWAYLRLVDDLLRPVGILGVVHQ